MKAFLSGYEIFLKFCNKIITIISNTALVILALVVALQIFGRYIFNVYFVWTEETSRYLMFWVVLLGAVKALQAGAHPRVTFVCEGIIKGVGSSILRILSSVASAIFFIILIIHGWRFSIMNFSQLSLCLRIPMTFIFIAMPIGGFFLLMNVIGDVIKEIISLKGCSPTEGVTQ